MNFEEKREKKEKNGFFRGIEAAIRRDGEDGSRGIRLVGDLCYALIGFLFSGCHLLFGAYPLGISILAVLPRGVLFALGGATVGSLMLGRDGLIYALVSLLTVLLRIIISGGERGKEEKSESSTAEAKNQKEADTGGSGFFSSAIFALENQSLIVRTSAAVIAGFVCATYQILLSGLSLESALFGVCMIVAPAILVFVFSGFIDNAPGERELIFGGKSIIFPPIRRRDDVTSVMNGIHFRISVLFILFFMSLALKKYNLFGVDLALVFSSAVTLFAAKRFGGLYGGVCGFVTSFGVSALYSVSFALAGAGAGMLFPLGTLYGTVLGGVLLGAWGAYAGGVVGFLSVLAEYALSAVCLFPILKYFERESRGVEDEDSSRLALDMVGTMALAYRNRSKERVEALEETLWGLSPIIKEFLNDKSAGLAQGREHPDAKGAPEEYYELFARIFEEVRQVDGENREMDEPLTEKLEGVFAEHGFPDGVIRAFGGRKKYIICAAEDRSGELITSRKLFCALEKASGYSFSSPDYYRRGNMALMECSARARFHLETAYASKAGASGEVSGDSFRFFKSEFDESYLLISDGMGSGKGALETSVFACDFLSKILGAGVGITPSLHGLNGIIRERAEECSVTVDLFSFDMLTGSGVFVKSGASPSFIKRGDSLFRIKSETMPLGLLKRVDAERVSADFSPGDIIVMLSDGIADNGDDAPWLLELLNKPPSRISSLKLYAEEILRVASGKSKRPDDMTVALARVKEIK